MLAVLGIITFIMLAMSISNLDRCVKLGYPSSRTTINLDFYCVKRVNGTDVVIKL